ncbi:hypothetical protein NPIL_491951 [Nephila pilipes]|uniref:Uncharacterized protein n=1 Tax=Nephila pilipes TaxID=299642 RepID=A0A8X6N974_NEPPI|nr:hypothetical protein NPIL_491951 [Nephila pilipes]
MYRHRIFALSFQTNIGSVCSSTTADTPLCSYIPSAPYGAYAPGGECQSCWAQSSHLCCKPMLSSCRYLFGKVEISIEELYSESAMPALFSQCHPSVALCSTAGYSDRNSTCRRVSPYSIWRNQYIQLVALLQYFHRYSGKHLANYTPSANCLRCFAGRTFVRSKAALVRSAR